MESITKKVDLVWYIDDLKKLLTIYILEKIFLRPATVKRSG
jgi:hypothetical protein